MELKYYLWKNRILVKEFAKQIEVAPSTITVVAHNKRSPVLMNAMKIHFETNGAVSLFGLLTLEDQKELNEKYPLVTKTSAYTYDTQMDLGCYICKNKTSRRAFAKKIDVARTTIKDIVNKTHSPTLFIAMKVHFETAGTVSLYELLSLKDREEINKKYSIIKHESIYTPNGQNDTKKPRREPRSENEEIEFIGSVRRMRPLEHGNKRSSSSKRTFSINQVTKEEKIKFDNVS
jgi:DNA-binding XRE family transcriptional regulator